MKLERKSDSVVSVFILASLALAGCVSGEAGPDPDAVENAAGSNNGEEVARVQSALSTGPCGVLDRYPGLGVMLDYTAATLELYDNPVGKMIAAATSVCSALNGYVDCRNGGGTESSCTGSGIAEGLCSFFGNSGLTQIHPLTVFARHYSQVVDPYDLVPNTSCLEPEDAPAGESSLHCCKYELSEMGCHSGFPAPSINCTIDYGAAALNSIGLPTCDNHPECVLSSTNQPEDSPLDNDPPTMDEVDRTMEHIWLQKLESAYNDVKPVQGPYDENPNQASACTLDALVRLGTFQGCRGWLDFVSVNRPFVGSVADWVAGGQTVDPSAQNQIFVRILANYAATRILLALPEGPSRMEYALVQQNNNYYRSADDVIADLEASRGIQLNPDAELRKWLSPCALEILKADLPYGWWKMLAYPGANEVATTLNPNEYEDACMVGGSPSIVSTQLLDGASTWQKQLRIEASDPESSTWAYSKRTTVAFELVSGAYATKFFDWQRNGATSVDTFDYTWDNKQASPIIDVAIINTAGNVAVLNERVVLSGVQQQSGSIDVTPSLPGQPPKSGR